MGIAVGSVTLFMTPVGGAVVNLGTAIESTNVWIETKAFDMGKANYVKFIERVIFHIRDRVGNPNLVVEIWGSDDEEEGFELLDTIRVGEEDPGYTDPPGKRFFKFIFRDISVALRWAVHGFTVYGELGGEEF